MKIVLAPNGAGRESPGSKQEKKVNTKGRWQPDIPRAREELRKWLTRYTHCTVQQGAVPTPGWPCGTCACDLLGRLGLDPKNPDFHARNVPPDRINEVWRAILQIRGTSTTRPSTRTERRWVMLRRTVSALRRALRRVLDVLRHER